ncbi:hypothetical protein B4124_4207 [Bacillus licheniformis]|nr:hypothetical protein B4164_1477 [Bacillus licheniformis]OLF88513.1 hypothetical protein B4094_4127 [Bacillus licheniformis]OLG00785.1 hypothetical protein B4124_4207 [Bacillus licheniformis]TWJ64537.1 hypothetical protein CHCC5020_3793 [Bacillus licheniformis]TWL66643.1 hypothetical protein CHCC15320_1032 [Bacillus licheniformis]
MTFAVNNAVILIPPYVFSSTLYISQNEFFKHPFLFFRVFSRSMGKERKILYNKKEHKKELVKRWQTNLNI